MRSKRGQSALEYIILVTLIIGAFVTVGNYFARGLMGRWKMSTDNLGDQYDPRVTNTDITTTLEADSQVRVTAIEAPGGFWTLRTDQSNSVESRTGTMRVGAF